MRFFTSTFALLATIVFVASVSTTVPIDGSVNYDDGQWVGTIACHFQNQSDCALSMHVEGRRIDVNTHADKEVVFVSCVSSDTSFALNILNFTYDDIQDYTCLEDTTQESNHTWLLAYPDLQVQGTPKVGLPIVLTCNSFVGAPLYWVLPGAASDNADVKIVTFVNEANSSTSASFKVQDSDNYAEYRCCIELKNNQFTDPPCAGYTIIFDDSVQVISTSQNYKDINLLNMQCVFRSNPTPDVTLIDWLQCSGSSCAFVVGSWRNDVDEAKHTLNSSLTAYSDTYSYVCLYDNLLNHTFKVDPDMFGPEVVSNEKVIFYSTEGYAVTLGCLVSANPIPEITWSKTVINDFSNGSASISNGGNYKIEVNQVSSTQWQATLVIFPFDVIVDNAQYNCIASNAYGQRSVAMNTNDGPNNLDLEMVANFNATYNNPNVTDLIWGICSFQMFPYPPTYEMTVLGATNIPYNLTISNDEQLSKVTVTSVFAVNKTDYPITVECTAFDRFDHTNQLTSRFIVDSNNFTTLAPTTTTTAHPVV